jgi:hypothetical protein
MDGCERPILLSLTKRSRKHACILHSFLFPCVEVVAPAAGRANAQRGRDVDAAVGWPVWLLGEMSCLLYHHRSSSLESRHPDS